MLVTVKFHGSLKSRCPGEYKVDAATPAEAIRGVTNQMRDKLRRKDGQMFICRVKECPEMIQLSSSLGTDELNIYPVFNAAGGGQGGATWGNIIIGALMIAAAVFLGPLAYGMVGLSAALLSSTAAWAVGLIGAGLMLEGVANLIWGVDTAKTSSNPESSRAFGNNSSNSTKIGTRIAIGYGVYKMAGQYLSVNLQAVDRDKHYNRHTGKDGVFRFISGE